MKAKGESFAAGEIVEFQPETWMEWLRGVYVRPIGGDLKGWHTVKVPGETREISIGDVKRTIPASWSVPTRRIRKVST